MDTRLLWIKGGPGKGKTMLMIALVAELSKRLASEPKQGVLSYFFCQSTDNRLNNAISVLRGLIYLLIVGKRTPIEPLREEYDVRGKQLFDGKNAFFALRRILLEMLRDSSLTRVYLLIDALDECDYGLSELLGLTADPDFGSLKKIKWLVASRNESFIEAKLRPNSFRVNLSLELNSSYIALAVQKFIDSKVQELAGLKNYTKDLEEYVRSYLSGKAEGTFLWAALVCKELERVRTRKTKSVLTKFPSGLDSLYERILERIRHDNDTDDVNLCERVLAAMTLSFRPLHIRELPAMAGLPENESNLESLIDILALCGSFVAVQKATVYFVHQSVKNYLSANKSSDIFPLGQAEEHRRIIFRSLELMSITLKKDICGLREPGALASEATTAGCQDLLTPIRYACCYWVDHLRQVSHLHQDEISLFDGGKVHIFLLEHFLHWLEALGLMGEVSKAVLMIADLQSLLKVNDSLSTLFL